MDLEIQTLKNQLYLLERQKFRKQKEEKRIRKEAMKEDLIEELKNGLDNIKNDNDSYYVLMSFRKTDRQDCDWATYGIVKGEKRAKCFEKFLERYNPHDEYLKTYCLPDKKVFSDDDIINFTVKHAMNYK